MRGDVAAAANAGMVRLNGEARFFFLHAALMMAIVLVGFTLKPLLGRVDYGTMPKMLYLHGLLFLAWCSLAMAQPWLIGRGDRMLHRRLGWIGVILALGLAVSGIGVTYAGVQAGRLVPAAIWFALNFITVSVFLAFVGAAIQLRRRTDWHRRLLACATVPITGPAWARILPMDALGPLGLPLLTSAVLMLVVIGMVHDRRTRKRIHPAWWWGAAGAAAPGLLSIPLAMLPILARWAESVPV